MKELVFAAVLAASTVCGTFAHAGTVTVRYTRGGIDEDITSVRFFLRAANNGVIAQSEFVPAQPIDTEQVVTFEVDDAVLNANELTTGSLLGRLRDANGQESVDSVPFEVTFSGFGPNAPIIRGVSIQR